ncbi:MAG: hypothetical protein ACM30I_06885 [Gemmatimonas sp.]
MQFKSLDEASEVAAEFRDRARELRDQADAAEPSRGTMLQTLARTYEQHARGLELYVESVRHVDTVRAGDRRRNDH